MIGSRSKEIEVVLHLKKDDVGSKSRAVEDIIKASIYLVLRYLDGLNLLSVLLIQGELGLRRLRMLLTLGLK